jgi:hypothetical protein
MNEREFGAIIQIGDILVSEEVICEYFACDYAACKGRCCVEGDGGAPLGEEEPEQLERAYDVYSPLMGEEGRNAVARDGFFTVDRDGDLVTPLCQSDGACAYLHRGPSGECLCSVELCFEKGLCSWRKPSSCSLYPIRLTPLSSGGVALNLHRWDICKAAYEKGRREGVRVYEFLRAPLSERFGAEFWEALDAAARHLEIE